MSLRITATGIRDGEFIQGLGKQCVGTVMQIRGDYPASIPWISQLDTTTLRDEFNHYGFFAKFPTVEERLGALNANVTDKDDLYMEDCPNLQVKFVKIGGEFFKKSLSPEELEMLLKGNPKDAEGYWLLKDVYNMFPRKPGSKARKHTLIFRPNNWTLMASVVTEVDTFTGLYVTMDAPNIVMGTVKKPKDGLMFIFKTEGDLSKTLPEFAIIYESKTTEPVTYDRVANLCGVYVDVTKMHAFKPMIDWFPPSLYKSLIQKCIRLEKKFTEFGGAIYETKVVLLTAIALLISHRGSFVPNIQRFVTGLEAGPKRIGVSIEEDGYIDEPAYLMMMHAASLTAQHHSAEWNPTDTQINVWLYAAFHACSDKRMYEYDWTKFDGRITEYSFSFMSYIFLNQIKSFKTDIDMVGSIAVNKSIPRKETAQPDDIELNDEIHPMPLIHCIDHHSFTEIAHFMPYVRGQTIKDIFSMIWNQVVGINPRKPNHYEKIKTMDKDESVLDVRDAQRWMWLLKSPTSTKADRDVILDDQGVMKTTPFTYDLDLSWIAALIGPIEVKVGTATATVVIRTDDIYRMTVVRKPKREDKVITEFTEEEKALVIDVVEKSILTNGVVLKNVPSTLSHLKGAKVALIVKDESRRYVLSLSDGSQVAWEDYVHLQYNFPIHKPVKLDTWRHYIEYALTSSGEGIQENATTEFDRILATYSVEVLRRIRMYLVGYKSDIELYKISRDGSSVEYQVATEDIAVNHFLCAVCVLYPAALVKTTSGFKIRNGPLMWSLRDVISQKLYGLVDMTVDPTIAPNGKIITDWIPIPGDGRKMWEHQLDSLQAMVTRHHQDRKGHGLWLPVGCGKTLIVLAYIKHLYDTKRLPPYCVYTLPPSAIDSIKRELTNYGIAFHEIDMRLGSLVDNKTLKPYVVNLINHDHMRMNGMDDQLRDISNQLVFIVDEFHKTLNKTIRTSLALEIARLCVDFIALSGTLIKDNNAEDLIAWLEQIVSFEVTVDNYWVAIGALISKKVQTNVVVDRVDIDVPMLPTELEVYRKTVPAKLGGTAAHINIRAAIDYCYTIVTRRMVADILTYIQMGEIPFVIANSVKHQHAIRDALITAGIVNIHLITKDTPITLTPQDITNIQVIITTIRHSAGYTLTKCRVTLTSVYFSNEATREQLLGRTDRAGQLSPNVLLLTYHTGILTYLFKNYEKARTLAQALKGFAQTIEVDVDTVLANAE
jgi:hypothetical protein